MNVYDAVVGAGYPLRRWARLEVRGQELLPADGPLLVVANHDSMIDPLAVAAACHPRRYLRFLAMAELWRNPAVRLALDAMGHIPLERGGGGTTALRRAIEALQDGEAIGIFPEGRLSRGRAVRARTGVAHLIAACPEASVMLAAVTGADDVVRFPKRPRAHVQFVLPMTAAQPEDAAALSQRLLDEIRVVVPPVLAGRRGRLAATLRERRAQRRD